MSTTTTYTATDSFTDEQTFDTFRKTVTLTSGYCNGELIYCVTFATSLNGETLNEETWECAAVEDMAKVSADIVSLCHGAWIAKQCAVMQSIVANLY